MKRRQIAWILILVVDVAYVAWGAIAAVMPDGLAGPHRIPWPRYRVGRSRRRSAVRQDGTDSSNDISDGKLNAMVALPSPRLAVWTVAPPEEGTSSRVTPARWLEVYSSVRRSSCALTATITVLADISTAANAGGRRIPRAARTPAANGMATML
jgi:hypothetical protein